MIIPYQNIENLMLADEIVAAVKEGSFHIYAIKHIYEGIEILTGESYERIQQQVNEKLEFYHKIADRGTV